MKVCVTSRSFSRNQELRSLLLEKYSDVKFNDEGISLKDDALIEFLKDADKAIIALEKIDEKVLESLPKLKVISKYGVGLNNLSLSSMKTRGVCLGWTSGVNKRSVSELTLSFAIALFHNAFIANNVVKDGQWRQITGNLITNKTIGIIGLGNVGKDLVQLLKPFSCRILSYDIDMDLEFCKKHNVESVSMSKLLKESDLITCHVPYNETTEDLISEEEINQMKDGIFLINTARGGIINENALLKGLNSSKIAGAAIDVLKVEPPISHELTRQENVFVTPHIGGSAKEAILDMGKSAITGLDSFISWDEVL